MNCDYIGHHKRTMSEGVIHQSGHRVDVNWHFTSFFSTQQVGIIRVMIVMMNECIREKFKQYGQFTNNKAHPEPDKSNNKFYSECLTKITDKTPLN